MAITVNRSPIPATVASALRSVFTMLGTWAVARGWVKPEEVPGLVTIGLTLAAAAYGIWKAHSKSADLATVAHLVPDSVAKVK